MTKLLNKIRIGKEEYEKKWGFIMVIKDSNVKRLIEHCAKQYGIGLQKMKNVDEKLTIYAIISFTEKEKENKLAAFKNFIDDIESKHHLICNFDQEKNLFTIRD